MYIYRKLITKLIDWQTSTNRKPLILRGARQVGKSRLVVEFSKTYSQKILLNLERDEDRNLFETLTLDKLIEYLYLKNGFSKEVRTLIFIDEIQESPKAIDLLRFFYEDYPYIHVIAAGSLLEFALKNIKSFPVGRVHQLAVFPVSFEEFLKASKPNLLEHFYSVPVADIAHPLLLEQFHLYTLLGGMPEVLSTYLDTESFYSIKDVYEDLWQGYKEDARKYARNDTDRKVLLHILNTAHLEKDRIKYQHFGQSNYKSREVSEAFTALEMSKIIQPIHPTTTTAYPAIPNTKRSPRLQYLDTGLLVYLLNIQAEIFKLKDLTDFLRGKIIQHIVSQEMIVQQSQLQFKPLFWVREADNSNAEVDNLYVGSNYILPIEIKSGKKGSLRSLMQFVDEAPINRAIRLSANQFSMEQAITLRGKAYNLYNIPYYHCTQIEKYMNIH